MFAVARRCGAGSQNTVAKRYKTGEPWTAGTHQQARLLPKRVRTPLWRGHPTDCKCKFEIRQKSLNWWLDHRVSIGIKPGLHLFDDESVKALKSRFHKISEFGQFRSNFLVKRHLNAVCSLEQTPYFRGVGSRTSANISSPKHSVDICV